MAKILSIDELRKVNKQQTVHLQMNDYPALEFSVNEVTNNFGSFEKSIKTEESEMVFRKTLSLSGYYTDWRCWDEQPTSAQENMPFKVPDGNSFDKFDIGESIRTKLIERLNAILSGAEDEEDEEEEPEEKPAEKPKEEKPVEDAGHTPVIGGAAGFTHWYKCGICGFPIDIHANFCSHCGKKINWKYVKEDEE